jgi:DNA-binding response OmpR family regulator
MADAQRILLVDDDKSISEILAFNLRNDGFDVETAYSAEEALEKDFSDFQILLLDIMMGGMSGLQLAEKLRNENIHIPIIFLTARDTENDMLTGFSAGADDYISKPFSVKEVIARVKAVLKRASSSVGQSAGDRLEVDQLIINFKSKEVFIAEEAIVLTKTEFELLSLLARHPGTLYSRERIIERIWKETPYITERTVDVHIARIRKKLRDYGSMVTSRTGYGYQFNK